MTAVFSPDRVYRYYLERTIDPLMNNQRSVCFVMLNPSIADETRPDHTITKCIGFAKRWGYGTLRVVNLFALVSTDPKGLVKHGAPIGPDNDRWITKVAWESERIVCAWGAHGTLHSRGRTVWRLLKNHVLESFKTTENGQPWHPLMLAYDTPLSLCEEPFA